MDHQVHRDVAIDHKEATAESGSLKGKITKGELILKG